LNKLFSLSQNFDITTTAWIVSMNVAQGEVWSLQQRLTTAKGSTTPSEALFGCWRCTASPQIFIEERHRLVKFRHRLVKFSISCIFKWNLQLYTFHTWIECL